MRFSPDGSHEKATGQRVTSPIMRAFTRRATTSRRETRGTRSGLITASRSSPSVFLFLFLPRESLPRAVSSFPPPPPQDARLLSENGPRPTGRRRSPRSGQSHALAPSCDKTRRADYILDYIYSGTLDSRSRDTTRLTYARLRFAIQLVVY